MLVNNGILDSIKKKRLLREKELDEIIYSRKRTEEVISMIVRVQLQ